MLSDSEVCWLFFARRCRLSDKEEAAFQKPSFLCNQYYHLSTIETVYRPGYYLFYKNRFAVHDQTLRVFHIWIAARDEVRHYCGKAVVDASVSPEWAFKLKCDLICPDCLRNLQIELDSQTKNRPDSS